MSMEFWKEGLFLFINNGVIWSKSGEKYIFLFLLYVSY